MVSTRFLGLVSTALLVVGALAVGEALHRTVVAGTVPITSPLMVVYYVLGAACILLGYRFRRPVAREYGLGSDDEREPSDRGPPSGRGGGSDPDPGSGPGAAGDDEGFDPAMSPLGDAAPGDARTPDGPASDPDRERDDRADDADGNGNGNGEGEGAPRSRSGRDGAP